MRHLPPKLGELLQEDSRFRLEAYQFVQDSLVYAQNVLHPAKDVKGSASSSPNATAPEPHLTGQQLCDALRLRAIEQYGYLAKSVLNRWGVRATSDFGDIVYNLIKIECLKKSNSDRREDFNDVYNFDEVFRQEFRIVIED